MLFCVERLHDFLTHSLRLHDFFLWWLRDILLLRGLVIFLWGGCMNFLVERLHDFFVERLSDFVCGEVA